MGKTFIGPLTFDSISPNSGLEKALCLSPEKVISTIEDAKLRGRGGAGFPTAIKLRSTAREVRDTKYVICNADEGEPGTFKDRVLLSNYTSLILEGMTICAYATGAKKGVIYLRGEYSYLKDKLTEKIRIHKEKELAGSCEFEIEIFMGAGAYICGEETALIESMEGARGEPRDRPPFPFSNGYLGYPTIIDNVETFAWIAAIMDKGAEAFNSVGTADSRGPKIVSVSGDCECPGVFEFPYGTTIQTVLETAKAINPKAVQVGGASGRCLDSTQFSRTISHEDVPTSGAIIILGQDRDMLKVVKNFLEFFADESCGQCTPCREGTRVLLEGVNMMLAGSCSNEYLNELIGLSETMQVASKCGLGQSAPNAFLSVIEAFKNEILGRTQRVEGEWHD